MIFLYFYLFSRQGDFLPFYKVCSRESDYQNVAEQIAKFAFIADTMPEELPKGLGYISGRLLDEVIDSEATILNVDFKAFMPTRCINYFDTICEPLQEDKFYVKYKEQALKMLLQLMKNMGFILSTVLMKSTQNSLNKTKRILHPSKAWVE